MQDARWFLVISFWFLDRDNQFLINSRKDTRKKTCNSQPATCNLYFNWQTG